MVRTAGNLWWRLMLAGGACLVMDLICYFDFEEAAKVGHAKTWGPMAELYNAFGRDNALMILGGLGAVLLIAGFIRKAMYADDTELVKKEDADF